MEKSSEFPTINRKAIKVKCLQDVGDSKDDPTYGCIRASYICSIGLEGHQGPETVNGFAKITLHPLHGTALLLALRA